LWTRSCLPSATAARKGRVGAAPSPTSIGCPELASGADLDRWCRTRVRRPLLPVATKGECSVTALGAAALDHKRPSVSAPAGRLLAAKSERAYPSVEYVAETSSQSTKGALQVGAPEDFPRRRIETCRNAQHRLDREVEHAALDRAVVAASTPVSRQSPIRLRAERRASGIRTCHGDERARPGFQVWRYAVR
jgi:hypothetical protein